MMLYVIVSHTGIGSMPVNAVQKQPSGKAHIVLTLEQASFRILWSADLTKHAIYSSKQDHRLFKGNSVSQWEME